jgi:hypothetical protein
MSYYYYYSKIDKTQEKLGKIEAHSEEEAIKKLAEVKRLDIDSLLKLWGVEKLDNESKKRF